MTTPSMSTADRLRQAIADTLSIDAQGLQAAIGQLVVATSADYPHAAPAVRSLHSAEVRTTVLLADRIPAGQEAQALAQEIALHHGRQAAKAVLGECAAELLGDAKSVIEERVMRDYRHYLGKVVLVNAISGFVGQESFDIPLKSPAKVRVEETSEQSIKRWIDDWCDPLYEIALVEDHAQLRDVRSMWIHGPSLHLNGKQTEASDIIGWAPYTDPNEFLLREYDLYVEHVAEGDPMQFDDWLAGSDIPGIVLAREAAKAQSSAVQTAWQPQVALDAAAGEERGGVKKFLVPTFIVVEALSAQAAQSKVSAIQGGLREQDGVPLHIDATLPTVEVSAGPEAKFHSVLDLAEIESQVRQLVFSPEELRMVQSAVTEYRELISSPTSADRDALGHEWADHEVDAADALLGTLKKPTIQPLEESPGPGM